MRGEDTYRDEPPPRDVPMPTPSEFQPAQRGRVAAVEPRQRASAERRSRSRAGDPWPGFGDDDATPAPPSAPAPKTKEPVAVREREPPLRAPAAAPASVGSCEAVIATANEVMDMNAGRGAADVTRGAYASLLERGSYFMPCGVPASMSLDVCAAVRDGRAVGITVVTRPADARVAACVRNAVAGIAFPRSPRLDVTRTRFGR